MSKINEEDFKGKSRGKSEGKPKKKSSGPPKRKPGESAGGKSAGGSDNKGKKFSKGPSGERSERKPGEYPKKRTGDSPERKSGDRPERKSGDYPKKKTGDNPERRSSEYPKGKSGDRPERKSGDYPKKRTGDGPERKSGDYSKGKSGDRPERKSGDYSKGKSDDRPEWRSNDRPERKYNDRPERKWDDRGKPKPKPNAKVQSSIPHQGRPKDKPKDKDSAKDMPKFHPRNPHKDRYDLKLLAEACPELEPFIKMNMHNDQSIDFNNLEAVKLLNKALLKQYYGIETWDIPAGYQCPAVPLRADYIHHIASLLGTNHDSIPLGKNIRCLDIGVGASLVFPIISAEAYGWSFVGSEVDPVALESAKQILEANAFLQEFVELRLQNNVKDLFQGIVQPDEKFDLCICNPPYHMGAAVETAPVKADAPKGKKNAQLSPLTGILSNELSYEGGEEAFLQLMVKQSQQFRTSVYWFSSLVLKQSHLKSAYKTLQKIGVSDIKVIQMGQGNKSSRILAWTFMNKAQQEEWRAERWKTV